MSGADIIVERETANDESALVVSIHTPSGTAVDADAPIFDIEHSKATQELHAPRAGILVHDLKIGQSVDFGIPIARIISPEEWAKGDPGPRRIEPSRDPAMIEDDAPQVAILEAEPDGRSDDLRQRVLPAKRVSFAASALMREHALAPSQFGTGFITTRDVRERIRGQPGAAAKPRVAEAREMPTGAPVGGAKKAEIEALGAGAGGTMLSVLGTNLGPMPVRRAAAAFLDGKITDLVIYEAARLMNKYPNLNAHYADGRIFRHSRVHAGIAIDGGGRLVVYGIENADRIGLHALPDIIADAAARYLANELTARELSRATFTVTDLSADDLDFVLPLLPRGQSCILGITRSARSGFRLFAGFDHRVTEGREVSAFLRELSGRLASFVSHGRTEVADESRCYFCDRFLSELVSKSGYKGLLKVVNHRGDEVLCCASCWNGW